MSRRRLGGSHRPWPVPAAPWVMRMSWHDLCFLHWRVDPEAIAPRLPEGLELETYDGSAWVGVVPFRMTDVSPRGVPRIRRLGDFAELNVRTNVSAGGKPGVWFFSLDATSPLAVRIARGLFCLPYLDARIETRRDGDAVRYTSVRTHLGAGPAELTVRYRPTGPSTQSPPGSLEHFLTERYCLYAANRRGQLLRQEIDHAPWPLQPATAEIERCTMTRPLGIDLGTEPPLAHFAERLDVVSWLPRRVR
ncbi:MAG: uncharacterized protein QOE98_1586 [Gaiellaceae bacterium]|nr:uncharacterized protein [Gaiellaceae bacterium]